ncbi:MFS transporter [Streptomyces sp. CB01881]|uniref:MFS transporter n=1 Tax=Streptomyces sp. CB01881 TaxID=2078691 RepID=UPI000CDC4EE4|nr:MFS transporter [Streptomyces sp. CB01881]AUY48512.1 MFS transporter [Streptomyces sp. CB01881]TYC76999.1 DHA2 family efflux MFS transporter permease subunit [Streptomyces sp. CB01881]
MTSQTAPPRPATEAAEPEPAGYRLRWAALAVILAAEVMDLLDTTIVGVASPAVQRDFGGSDAQIQWISASYTLAFAVLLITGARLGDLLGRKNLFVAGAAGFTLASVLCAAAPGPGTLIAARTVQGLFAALLIPQGLGLIKAMFPPKETGAAFGLFGPVLGLSSVLGPTLGGYLTDADWFGTGWRMVFLINLPLGLLAVLAAVRILPADRTPRTAGAGRLDPVGVLVLSAAVLLLVYPLVQGRELDWPLWTYLSMAASLPVLRLFVLHQRRVLRRGGTPLIEPSLFAKRAFTSALATGLVFFAALSGLLLTFTLYLQLGLGWTSLHSGLSMIPLSLGIVVGAILSGGFLGPRFGRRVLHAGMAVAAAGSLGLWACVDHWAGGLTSWELIPALAATGFGLGLIMAPFFDIALAGVEDAETGSASGVLNAQQQLGGSIGVALLGTAFFGWAGPEGFQYAAGRTFGLTAGLMALAFLVAFLLPRHARPEGGH